MALLACCAIALSDLLPLQKISLLAVVALALGNAFRQTFNLCLMLGDDDELQKVSPGGTALMALLPESRVFGPLLMLAYDDSGKLMRLVLLSDSVANLNDWRRLRKWVRSRKDRN